MSRVSRRKRRQDFIGWMLIVFALVAIGGLAYVYHAATSHAVALNPDNMCPQSGPHSITVVLIDTTDPLDPVQHEDVRKQLEDIKDDVPRYGEIELFTVAPASDALLSAKLAACNPGRGSDIDPIYGNPALVEKRWQKAFSDKVDEVLGQLLQSQTLATSPIMESIQQIAVQAFVGQGVDNIPKRLIVVSDMLQNTPGFSQYRGSESFEEFRRSPYYIKVRPNLAGVDVTILYLRRLNARHLQGRRHIEFWQSYFSDAGATLVDVKSIEG
jgi:hypothetical protein